MIKRLTSLQKMVDNKTINATATYTSDNLDIRYVRELSCQYQAISASSTPDIKVEIQISYNGVDFITPSVGGTINSSVTDEVLHIDDIIMPLCIYCRIKVTGNASNPSDTVANVFILMRE